MIPGSSSTTVGDQHGQAKSSSGLTSTATPFVPIQKTQLKPTVSVPVYENGCTYFQSEANELEAVESTPYYHNPEPSGCMFDNLVEDSTQELTLFEQSGELPLISHGCVQNIRINEELSDYFDEHHAWLLRQLDSMDDRYKEIPTGYDCAFPLDAPAKKNSHRNSAGSWGYASHVYKVNSITTGETYALRRVENVKTNVDITTSVLRHWSKVRHASIVGLHDCFLARGALFFVYAFIPGAQTLKEYYFDTQVDISTKYHVTRYPPDILIPEQVLWSYIVQLVSLIHSVHASNMSCRAIYITHVIMSFNGRIRLNGVGIPDVLEYDSKKTPGEEQANDLYDLGILILSLINRRPVKSSLDDPSEFSVMNCNYSSSLVSLVNLLLSSTSYKTTISDIASSITGEIMQELSTQYSKSDEYLHDLFKSYQNGRLLQILLKLGTINERSEHDSDQGWAETGDRYLLKLFRDYVFHQVDDEGNPVLDFGHIIYSLNKFDVGSTEQILLSSRDGQSILIASFQDIKECAEKAFQDLVNAEY